MRAISAAQLLPPVMVVLAAVVFGQSNAGPQPDKIVPSSPAIHGDAAAGRAIVDGAGNCLTCHRVGASGSAVGPNLSDVGSKLAPEALKRFLVSPPEKIDAQDQLYEIVTRDGKTVRGKLLNQDPFSLQLVDTHGDLVAFRRSEIRDARFVEPQRMPSYQGRLTAAQIDDVVAYLASLRIPANLP